MFRNVFAVACLLGAAAPVSAEVVEKTGSGFVSHLGVEVSASPAEVWKSLIAPNLWWNKAHTYSGDAANLYLDAQAGGCFCEKLPLGKDAPTGARPGSAEHMRVIHAAPGRVLRLSGGLGPLQSEPAGGVLTITLKPTVSGTRILWEYVVGGHMRYKIDEIAPAVDKVMAGQLASLALHIDPKLAAAPGAADAEDAPAEGADEKAATAPKAAAPPAAAKVAKPAKP